MLNTKPLISRKRSEQVLSTKESIQTKAMKKKKSASNLHATKSKKQFDKQFKPEKATLVHSHSKGKLKTSKPHYKNDENHNSMNTKKSVQKIMPLGKEIHLVSEQSKQKIKNPKIPNNKATSTMTKSKSLSKLCPSKKGTIIKKEEIMPNDYTSSELKMCKKLAKKQQRVGHNYQTDRIPFQGKRSISKIQTQQHNQTKRSKNTTISLKSHNKTKKSSSATTSQTATIKQKKQTTSTHSKPTIKQRKNKISEIIQKSILYSDVNYDFKEQMSFLGSGVKENEQFFLPYPFQSHTDMLLINENIQNQKQRLILENEQCDAQSVRFKAAITIQRHFRGYIQRKYIQEAQHIIECIKLIQRSWRSYKIKKFNTVKDVVPQKNHLDDNKMRNPTYAIELSAQEGFKKQEHCLQPRPIIKAKSQHHQPQSSSNHGEISISTNSLITIKDFNDTLANRSDNKKLVQDMNTYRGCIDSKECTLNGTSKMNLKEIIRNLLEEEGLNEQIKQKIRNAMESQSSTGDGLRVSQQQELQDFQMRQSKQKLSDRSNCIKSDRMDRASEQAVFELRKKISEKIEHHQKNETLSEVSQVEHTELILLDTENYEENENEKELVQRPDGNLSQLSEKRNQKQQQQFKENITNQCQKKYSFSLSPPREQQTVVNAAVATFNEVQTQPQHTEVVDHPLDFDKSRDQYVQRKLDGEIESQNMFFKSPIREYSPCHSGTFNMMTSPGLNKITSPKCLLTTSLTKDPKSNYDKYFKSNKIASAANCSAAIFSSPCRKSLPRSESESSPRLFKDLEERLDGRNTGKQNNPNRENQFGFEMMPKPSSQESLKLQRQQDYLLQAAIQGHFSPINSKKIDSDQLDKDSHNDKYMNLNDVKGSPNLIEYLRQHPFSALTAEQMKEDDGTIDQQVMNLFQDNHDQETHNGGESNNQNILRPYQQQQRTKSTYKEQQQLHPAKSTKNKTTTTPVFGFPTAFNFIQSFCLIITDFLREEESIKQVFIEKLKSLKYYKVNQVFQAWSKRQQSQEQYQQHDLEKLELRDEKLEIEMLTKSICQTPVIFSKSQQRMILEYAPLRIYLEENYYTMIENIYEGQGSHNPLTQSQKLQRDYISFIFDVFSESISKYFAQFNAKNLHMAIFKETEWQSNQIDYLSMVFSEALGNILKCAEMFCGRLQTDDMTEDEKIENILINEQREKQFQKDLDNFGDSQPCELWIDLFIGNDIFNDLVEQLVEQLR